MISSYRDTLPESSRRASRSTKVTAALHDSAALFCGLGGGASHQSWCPQTTAGGQPQLQPRSTCSAPSQGGFPPLPPPLSRSLSSALDIAVHDNVLQSAMDGGPNDGRRLLPGADDALRHRSGWWDEGRRAASRLASACSDEQCLASVQCAPSKTPPLRPRRQQCPSSTPHTRLPGWLARVLPQTPHTPSPLARACLLAFPLPARRTWACMEMESGFAVPCIAAHPLHFRGQLARAAPLPWVRACPVSRHARNATGAAAQRTPGTTPHPTPVDMEQQEWQARRLKPNFHRIRERLGDQGRSVMPRLRWCAGACGITAPHGATTSPPFNPRVISGPGTSRHLPQWPPRPSCSEAAAKTCRRIGAQGFVSLQTATSAAGMKNPV